VSYRQSVVFAWHFNFDGNPYRLCHIAFRVQTADRNDFVALLADNVWMYLIYAVHQSEKLSVTHFRTRFRIRFRQRYYTFYYTIITLLLGPQALRRILLLRGQPVLIVRRE
jgi:hypothetical protein